MPKIEQMGEQSSEKKDNEKAEEIMTEEQKEESEKRKVTFEAGEKKGYDERVEVEGNMDL